MVVTQSSLVSVKEPEKETTCTTRSPSTWSATSARSSPRPRPSPNKRAKSFHSHSTHSSRGFSMSGHFPPDTSAASRGETNAATKEKEQTKSYLRRHRKFGVDTQERLL